MNIGNVSNNSNVQKIGNVAYSIAKEAAKFSKKVTNYTMSIYLYLSIIFILFICYIYMYKYYFVIFLLKKKKKIKT